MTIMTTTTAALLAVAFLAPPAAPPDRAPSGGDLLAGPAVTAAPEPRTLVHRDFDGRLDPIEGDVDLAAIRLLAVDAERLAKIEAIVVDRQSHFDRIALANYATIAEIGGLVQTLGRERTPDPAEVRRRARLAALYRDLSLELVDFEKRGSLLDECAAILSPEELAEARGLVAERTAAERDALAAAEPGVRPFELATRARLEGLGRMVRESIRRFASSANAELDRFRDELDLTPEQVETVRAVFGPIAIARVEGGKEDREVRAEAMRAFTTVYRSLDRAQRAKLASLRFREAMEREKARDAQPPVPDAATH